MLRIGPCGHRYTVVVAFVFLYMALLLVNVLLADGFGSALQKIIGFFVHRVMLTHVYLSEEAAC